MEIMEKLNQFHFMKKTFIYLMPQQNMNLFSL